MKLTELKNKFSNQLSELYPSEELQSFFVILSEKYLNLNRLETVLQGNNEVEESFSEKIENAIKRLKKFEPIQYIIGETEFYGLTFKLNSATLIPRPETEELVQWVIEDQSSQISILKLLDIGTGSGCIAISLAKHLPTIEVEAMDISEKAIEIARANAKENTVKVNFIHQDVLQIQDLPKKYNIIVSNPPYVRELEKKQMAPNVLNFEPDTALFVSNDDPLLFYRHIAQLAKTALVDGGLLYFEINEYLSKELILLLQELGFDEIELKKDSFGKNRMIKCVN